MHLKNLSFSILIASLLSACGGKEPLDKYELLERPPQIAVTPSAETANEANAETPVTSIPGNEKLTVNGLGGNIKLMGKKSNPLLKINLDFDNTWLLLTKTLRHLKIVASDHDRDRGRYLVAFGYQPVNKEEGIWSGLSGLFSEKIELHKYQLSVMQAGEQTDIVAKDIGIVTKAADPEANVEEVVNTKVRPPADSSYQLISVLYKTMQEGFEEDEKDRESGFFNDLFK